MFVGALVPRATRATAGGLAVLLALVLGYALLAKGIPALYPDYGRLARLRSPVGFWNALALLGDFALVLGLWRAAQRRFDGALLVFAGVLTVLLAYSRGGVVIAVIAAAAWLGSTAGGFESLLALVIGGGAALAVAGISLALHGVSDDGQPHSVRVARRAAVPAHGRLAAAHGGRRCGTRRAARRAGTGGAPPRDRCPLRRRSASRVPQASPPPRCTAAARRCERRGSTARRARAASPAGAPTRDSTGGSRRWQSFEDEPLGTAPARRRSSSRTGCTARSSRRP